MKKLLLFAALLSVSFFANAQSTTYKAFKVDVDLGYAIPSDGTGTKAGATFTIEPHYRVADEFALGLRFEGAALGYKNNIDKDAKISLLTSYCATGEYYFMKSSFRPFIGGGLGLFAQKAVAANTSSGTTTTVKASATEFGAFPRIGFEAGHFRMAATYDILGNNASYTSFTIGFFLGGGSKK
jgi:hypothetical protein